MFPGQQALFPQSMQRGSPFSVELEDAQQDEWHALPYQFHVDEGTALLQDGGTQFRIREQDFLDNIQLPNSPSVNCFITDMFIDASCQHETGRKRRITTSRRCLIDTGSDLNIITRRALQGLQSDVRPLSGYLNGAGGRAEIIGRTDLTWHLKRGCDPVRRRRLNRSNSFVVVDPTVPYKFDCILGEPWIQENMLVFMWICLKRHLQAQLE